MKDICITKLMTRFREIKKHPGLVGLIAHLRDEEERMERLKLPEEAEVCALVILLLESK